MKQSVIAKAIENHCSKLSIPEVLTDLSFLTRQYLKCELHELEKEMKRLLVLDEDKHDDQVEEIFMEMLDVVYLLTEINERYGSEDHKLALLIVLRQMELAGCIKSFYSAILGLTLDMSSQSNKAFSRWTAKQVGRQRKPADYDVVFNEGTNLCHMFHRLLTYLSSVENQTIDFVEFVF